MLSAEELSIYIRGCALNERASQKKIYNSFYGYAMAICDCYANNEDDAIEILNDGFLKIFKEIHRYKPAYANEINSFKGWLRKIMVYTAIDHFRKNKKHHVVGELDVAVTQPSAHEISGLDKVSYDEIIRFIQRLSPAYRTVLSLFIIEGFSHEEIAEQLGISVGTSKSNLAKARKQLQKILHNQNQTAEIKNVG
ncbi:MAG: sigma-70 family RNA polymerase sigma factor [Chitinophagales bacterium]|nr:sigma-70 family RNA polymerase sigma factor [Chitinophagales bacterium]